jgi:lactoylglutathione lyase
VASFLHTCYRIGDIERSVEFYSKLGFEEVARMPIGDEAINVFMGMPGEDPRLELTYNHGIDSYEHGSGYNHIAPEKPPYRPGNRTEGHRICFVRDPDGYRIELIGE